MFAKFIALATLASWGCNLQFPHIVILITDIHNGALIAFIYNEIRTIVHIKMFKKDKKQNINHYYTSAIPIIIGKLLL